MAGELQGHVVGEIDDDLSRHGSVNPGTTEGDGFVRRFDDQIRTETRILVFDCDFLMRSHSPSAEPHHRDRAAEQEKLLEIARIMVVEPACRRRFLELALGETSEVT